jgi:hypothetical protein
MCFEKKRYKRPGVFPINQQKSHTKMSARRDWNKPRTAAQHIGYLADGNNPTGLIVRLVTHSLVPMTAAEMAEHKSKRIVGTILSFPKLGFVSAPYSKKAKAGKESQAQPKRLLEPASVNDHGEVTSVRVYGFHKVNSNYDKGARDDEFVSTLTLGQTLTFYLNEFMFDTKEKNVFPEGTSGSIPAYSVIEVQLNPSHNQSKGYGLKIAKITPQAPTLYSYVGTSGFQALTRTADQAAAFIKECAQQCESVMNQVEQSRYAFVASVDRSARVVDIRDDLDFVRIECPAGSGTTPVPGVFSLDVKFEALQRFTNFPCDLTGARTLVDFAIAAGALRVFATYDDYYNHKEPALSQHRCVPLVDSEAFLAAVNECMLETSAGTVTFPVPWGIAHDPSLHNVAFCVSTVPIAQEEGEAPHDDVFDVKECLAPPSPDLSLVSPVCAFTKGYRILAGNPGSPDGTAEECFVLECYFNSAPKTVTGAGGMGRPGKTTGYKRVRAGDDE